MPFRDIAGQAVMASGGMPGGKGSGMASATSGGHSADSVSGSGGGVEGGRRLGTRSVMSRSVCVVRLDSTGGRSAAASAAAWSAFFFSRFLGLGRDLGVDERILDAGDRLQVDVLVRIDHQALPDHRRQRAAGHVVGRA